MKPNAEQTNILNLDLLLEPPSQEKIVSLPLQFQYLPIDILSKQFTKLNSSHQYRIHYLGPRFPNSLLLHKQYSSAGTYTKKGYNPLTDILQYERYEINMKKIVQSHFITEKLKNNHFYKSAIYYRAFQGMNPTLDKTKQFVFNSAFQSGNLDCVIKVKQNQFDLFLRIDSNTRGHLQWFYFSVKNGQRKENIILHICNISKSGTLYQSGMRPYILSLKKRQIQRKQWEQGGTCSFSQKPLRYNLVYERVSLPTLYELTIEYQFQQENDEVFFAYCVPYTYSQLINEIKKLPNQYVKTYTLGRSLTGVDIPVLHVTNHQSLSQKKNVILTGRVHPGQSNGSYVLQGFIKFLCSQSKQAYELRNRVNFIIMPMINPDGVIMGNSRTSAAGKDLNRQYNTTNQQLFPQICYAKNLIYRIKKKYGLILYLDFHGHSRKKNTFFYGPNYTVSQTDYYKCRIFPRLIQKISNPFRYYSCSFVISQSKKSTARAVLFQQFKIPYTYTVQSSIGFYYDSQLKLTFCYDAKAWETMGSSIAQGFCQFICSLEQYEQVMKERRLQRKRIRQKRQAQKKNTKKFAEDGKDQQSKISLKKILFMQIIDQIKSLPKQADLQQSSDQHDSKQDLQASKFAQFNNLVSGKIQPGSKKIKLQGLNGQQKIIKKKITQQDDKDQLNIIRQIKQQKNKKQIIQKKQQIKYNKKIPCKNKIDFIIQKKSQSQIKKISKYQINRPIIYQRPSTNFNRISSKKILKPDTTQGRYVVLARQFFPQPKCQFIQFPKYSQVHNLRKDNMIFKTARQSFSRQLRSKQISKNNYQIFIGKKVFPNSRFKKGFNYQQDILQKSKSMKQPIKMRQQISTLGRYPFYEPSMMGIKQNLSEIKKKKNQIFPADFLQAIQLDNMALTIKTFDK